MRLRRSGVLRRVPLKTKLVLSFLMSAIFPLLIAAGLSFRTIARQAEQSAAREMVTIAEAADKTATEFMDSRCGEILVWSKLRFMKEVLDVSEMSEEVSESLREMVEFSGVYDAIALVDAGGGKCAAASRPELFHEDFSRNTLFTEAKSGKTTVSPLERNAIIENADKESGGWTLAIATPVKIREQVKGVLIAYLRWKSLEKLLIGSKVAQTGYVFIVDKNNRIILHPNRSFYGLQLSANGVNLTLLENAIHNRKLSVSYESDGAVTGKRESRTVGIAYPKPMRNLQDVGWKTIADASSAEVLLLPNIVGTLAVIAVGAVVVVLAVSLVLAGRISTPIAAIAEAARRVADRDLSVEAPQFVRADEVGDLSAAFGSMMESIKGQITHMLQATGVLKGAVGQITSSVSEVAASAAQVAGSVTETAATLEEIRQSAKMSGDKAKNLAHVSRGALGASMDGRAATDGMTRGMQVIKDQVSSVGETVTRLNEHSMSIEQIISSVKDLADQSNLLAVNASIEAARAGEMGKGFSVVANEIKSLADQSRQATFQIEGKLQNIQKGIGAVVMSMEQVNAAVDVGIGQSSKTEAAIAILNQSIEMSSQEAGFIEMSNEQQSVSMDQVSVAMTSIEDAMSRNLHAVGRLEEAAGELGDLGEQVRALIAAYRT